MRKNLKNFVVKEKKAPPSKFGAVRDGNSVQERRKSNFI